MVKLRDYQEEAVQSIAENFATKKFDKDTFRQYVEMPTGSGKTVTFLSYAERYHKKILIIVPSKQLMYQVYENALLFYREDEISRKGDKHDDEIANLHICIINSIRDEYLELLSVVFFDLVIIDEAHHSQANSYKKFIKKSNCQYFLGVTATPNRVDGKLLKEILGECSFKIGVEELIEKKYLSDIEGFSIKTNIDLSEVDSHNGDFSLNQLFRKVSNKSRNDLILDIYKKEMKGRKTIIFCVNIEHSLMLFKLFKENDISCAHIDGTMKDYLRKRILRMFHTNEINVIFNCQLLTEGFDEPSIDGIILARPTRSRGLFNQMIGRGLRISPGKKNCKIIDVVDNHKSLAGFTGLIEEDSLSFLNPNSFKSVGDIRDFVKSQITLSLEYQIERVNFFSRNDFVKQDAFECMEDYLQRNNITYYKPITFDEASFLIWHNELKKEYENGNYLKNKK